MLAHEIGEAAGIIWRTLESEGEQSLAQLRKTVKIADPVFSWAVGWLAREDKINVFRDKRAFRISLK